MPGRKTLCAALGASALALAGCGSSPKPASHTTTGGPSTSTSTSTSASSTDCNTLGINPTGMREGKCTHAGITYVIVDENHTLTLHTLTASLVGIRTASTLIGNQPATAQGKFVIASIKLANRLGLPQTFDKAGTHQAELILDGTVYPEDANLEGSSDASSCLAARASLAPGKSQICQVLFDVPSGAVAHLGRHGSGDLYLVDFGSDLAGSPPPQVVGQIRLYH